MTTERSRLTRTTTVLGIVLLVAAAAGAAYPLWWDHNSSDQGQRLLNQGFNRAAPKERGHPPVSKAGHLPVSKDAAACDASLPSQQSTDIRLSGILEIPALKLKAPVLQGLTDAVLNIAVGHDPSSPWPGSAGESVVEAHDVSYFSAIDSLRKGDRVIWRDACHEWTYEVIATEISTPGTLLYPPKMNKGLALITCYPTNALFWTPERYIVETEFVSGGMTHERVTPPAAIAPLKVPAPADLVAQGLTLQTNPVVLGSLFITGAPAHVWREGPAPLDVEADALESYFGAEKAVAQQNRRWWSSLSVPGLGMSLPWSNAFQLSVTIDVVGTSVRWVTLSSATVRMRLVVQRSELLIAQVSVTEQL